MTDTVAAPPQPVQAARALLVIVAISHLVVPAIMIAHEGILSGEIAVAHPELSGAALASATAIAIRAAVIFHALLFVLSLVPAIALGRPRRWARRLAIVSQGLSIVFSVVSWRSSGMFHALIPVIDLIQVAIIVLLVRPASTKQYFAPRV